MKALKRIFTFLSLFALAVWGSIITAWQFMQIYATVTIPVLLCAAGAACGACFGSIIYLLKLKHVKVLRHIIRLLAAAALAVAVWKRFDEIAGGMAYIINFFIEEINGYYGVGMYYIYITPEMIEAVNQPLFAAIACGIAGYGYMSVLLNGRGVWLAVTAAIVLYMLPATLEAAPSELVLLGVLSFAVCLMVQGAIARGSKKLSGRASLIYAVLPVLVLSLGLSALYMKLVPKKNYTVPAVFDEMKGKIFLSAKDVQVAIDGYKGKAERGSSSVGTGIIGKVDEVVYKDEPVFVVHAPKNGGTLYLKAFQAADYSKRRWKELDGSVYEAYSGMFERLNDGSNTPLLMGYHAVSKLTDMGAVGIKSASYDIKVTQHVGDGNSYIPMSAIQIDGKSVDFIADTDMNIRLAGDKEGAEEITHSYRLAEWRNFSSIYKLVVNGAVLADVNDEYRHFVYDYYLDTDDACDDRIKNELFELIKSDDYSLVTSSGKAAFILDTLAYLADNYQYTLSPGTTPSGKDYVEYFLFEQKKGLCTHFASAAAMILRSAGIPTRYVEGYVVPENLFRGNASAAESVSIRGDGGLCRENWSYYDVVVTDRYAHAWIEVYLDGIGWVNVDPTPGYATQYLRSQNYSVDEQDNENNTQEDTTESDTDESSSETGTAEKSSEELSAGEPGERTTEDGEPETATTTEAVNEVPSSKNEGGGSAAVSGESSKEGETYDEQAAGGIDISVFWEKAWTAIRKVLSVLLLCLEIAAVPALIVVFLAIRQKCMEQNRVKLYNKDCGFLQDERIRRIMCYYARLLKYSKAEDVKSRTLKELSADVFGDVEGFDEVFRIVDKAMYSDRQPDESEVMKVMVYVDNVRSMVYGRLGIFGKLIFKYILAL